jgi:hypothetical protein
MKIYKLESQVFAFTFLFGMLFAPAAFAQGGEVVG